MKEYGHLTHLRLTHPHHGMEFRRRGEPAKSGIDGEWIVVALGLGLLALALGFDALSVLAVLGLTLAICWARRHPEAESDGWPVAVRVTAARRNRQDARGEKP